jgi:hypothetical protein
MVHQVISLEGLFYFKFTNMVYDVGPSVNPLQNRET